MFKVKRIVMLISCVCAILCGSESNLASTTSVTDALDEYAASSKKTFELINSQNAEASEEIWLDSLPWNHEKTLVSQNEYIARTTDFYERYIIDKCINDGYSAETEIKADNGGRFIGNIVAMDSTRITAKEYIKAVRHAVDKGHNAHFVKFIDEVYAPDGKSLLTYSIYTRIVYDKEDVTLRDCWNDFEIYSDSYYQAILLESAVAGGRVSDLPTRYADIAVDKNYVIVSKYQLMGKYGNKYCVDPPYNPWKNILDGKRSSFVKKYGRLPISMGPFVKVIDPLATSDKDYIHQAYKEAKSNNARVYTEEDLIDMEPLYKTKYHLSAKEAFGSSWKGLCNLFNSAETAKINYCLKYEKSVYPNSSLKSTNTALVKMIRQDIKDDLSYSNLILYKNIE